MSEAEIKRAHAAILAREAAFINMINDWDRNAKTRGFAVLDADPVPAGAQERQRESSGFPVLLESF